MMSPHPPAGAAPELTAQPVSQLSNAELARLAAATRETIEDGADSSWSGAPTVDRLEAFWRGVLLAPHRRLVLGRLDGEIAGALQLIRPGPMQETGPYVAEIASFFVVPWARGHGLARALIQAAEATALEDGIRIVDMSVRANRSHAIALIESMDYQRWGEKAHYAWHDGGYMPGYFYTKKLTPGPA